MVSFLSGIPIALPAGARAAMTVGFRFVAFHSTYSSGAVSTLSYGSNALLVWTLATAIGHSADC